MSIFAVQEGTVNLGAIVDSTNSYSGKIAKTAIKLAVEDVNNGSHLLNGMHTRLFLHLQEAKTPLETASAAIELLGREVVALIEAETSEAVPFASDIGEAANVPFLSLSASSPAISNQRFPYFVRLAYSDRIQMKAIATLINHYSWRSIVFLHSDHDFGSGAASAVRDALQDLNCEIVYTTMIPSTAQKRTIREELYKLVRTIKSSVFVVHTPCDLSINLLTEAQELGIMEAGYVWITTQEFTSLWDYVLNASTMSSMQGLLGIKTIIPNSKNLNDFTQRWERQFRLDNPNIKNFELNSYAVLAYDTVLMISRAIEKMERNARLSFLKPATSLGVMANSKIKVFEQGGMLLQEIFSTNFAGLSGNVEFHDAELYGYSYEIVNVVGKSYQAVGYLPYNSSKFFKTPSFANEGLRFVIEHKINPHFRGNSIGEVITLFWFAFSTVFYAHQERIRNGLSRIVVVVWLFVAFVLTSSYTANLSSRLTAQQIIPAINGLGNYKVGYSGPHVGDFLTANLGMEAWMPF